MEIEGVHWGTQNATMHGHDCVLDWFKKNGLLVWSDHEIKKSINYALENKQDHILVWWKNNGVDIQ